MSSTDIVSNETGKDISKKMDTMNTVPLGMEPEVEVKFDDEAEAIAVTTDHAGEPQRWGKGIIRDFKRTVGTNWFKEMKNFNQKTVAVTVSADPRSVLHLTSVTVFTHLFLSRSAVLHLHCRHCSHHYVWSCVWS
jgi:hypothetical protein